MRKPTIKQEDIFEATISMTTKLGLEHVTTKKVAVEMGISEGAIFYYFSNKKELLIESMYYIDRQIDAVLRTVPFHGIRLMPNVKRLWTAYFVFFLDHPTYPKFYRDIRWSSYFDRTAMAGQVQSFPFFAKFAKRCAALMGLNLELFWIFLIETTLNFAVRICAGEIERTDSNIDRIFRLMSYGLHGVVKKYNEKDFEPLLDIKD